MKNISSDEQELIINRISYIKEKEIKLYYNGQCIGKYFLDFIIEDKIILELKVVPFIQQIHIKQVLEYLRATNKRLAILIYFTNSGVIYKRIVNPNYKEENIIRS
jgi:GxxExxY protein